MSARRIRLIALGALLVAPVAGCAADEPAPAQTSSSSAASTPTAAPSATATTTPPPVSDGGEPMEALDSDSDGATQAPVWDEASRTEAQTLALQVMTAYARPGVPAEQWWAEFSSYLSDQAAYDYQWVDPTAIAPRAVTGPAAIADDSSVYLAQLTVPTDAGTYRVLLSREDGPTPWRVERITPPESLEQPDSGTQA
ncbi:hypothetical protein [Georgenia muralis]